MVQDQAKLPDQPILFGRCFSVVICEFEQFDGSKWNFVGVRRKWNTGEIQDVFTSDFLFSHIHRCVQVNKYCPKMTKVTARDQDLEGPPTADRCLSFADPVT